MPSFFHFGRGVKARDEHDEAHDTTVQCGILDEKRRERRRSWGLFRRRADRERQIATPTPSPPTPVASPSVLSNLRRRLSGNSKNSARHKRIASTSRLPSDTQASSSSILPSAPSTRTARHVRSFSAPLSSSESEQELRRSVEEQAEIESLQEFANSIRELMGEFRRATAAMQEEEARRAATSPAPPTVREDDTPLSPIAEDGEDADDGDDDDDLYTTSTSSSSTSPATPTGFGEMDMSAVARLPYIPEDDEYEVENDDNRDAQVITIGISRDEINDDDKNQYLPPETLNDNVNDTDERNDTGTTLVPALSPPPMNDSPTSSEFSNQSPENSIDADTESDSELDTDVPASFVSADDGIDDGVWSEGSESSFGVLLDDTTLNCTRLESTSEPDLVYHSHPLPLSREPTPRPLHPNPATLTPLDHQRTPTIQIPFPNSGHRDPPSYAETTASKSSSCSQSFFTAPSTFQSSPTSYYTPPSWTSCDAPLLSPFIGPQTQTRGLGHRDRASMASQIQNQLEELSLSLREAKLRARSSSNFLASSAASASFLSLGSSASCEVEQKAEQEARKEPLELYEDVEVRSERSMLRRRNTKLEKELERVNEELRQLKAKHELLLRTIDFAQKVGHLGGRDPENSEEQLNEFNKLKLHVEELQVTVERLADKNSARLSTQGTQPASSQSMATQATALPALPPSTLNIISQSSRENHTLLQRRALSTSSSPLWTPPHTPHTSQRPLDQANAIGGATVTEEVKSVDTELGMRRGHERSGSLQERAQRRKYGVARRRAGSLDSEHRQRGCAVC